MANTVPEVPKTKKVAKAPKALRTFTWSKSTKDSDPIHTFVAGYPVTGFPEELYAKYRAAGLITPVKTEDDE